MIFVFLFFIFKARISVNISLLYLKFLILIILNSTFLLYNFVISVDKIFNQILWNLNKLVFKSLIIIFSFSKIFTLLLKNKCLYNLLIVLIRKSKIFNLENFSLLKINKVIEILLLLNLIYGLAKNILLKDFFIHILLIFFSLIISK
jgi:hypothetical protein